MKNEGEIFSTYQRFPDSTSALELMNILEEHAVPFEIEDNTPQVSNTILGSSPENVFIIKIRQQDFEYVNRLEDEALEENLTEINEDYPLLQFTNEELMDVIRKPDEWSRTDFLLAKRLLKERDIELTEEEIEEEKKVRLEELSRPAESEKALYQWGYFFAIGGASCAYVLITNFHGFFINISSIALAVCAPCSGLILMRTKKTLPNGNQVFMFSEKDRKHGQYIFIIGLIASLVFFITLFVKQQIIFQENLFGH